MRGVGILIFLSVAGCSSAPKYPDVLAPRCQATNVREADLEPLGFTPRPGQVVVMRISASWCPFCKMDLKRIGDFYRSGRWQPTTTQIFLLAYANRGETRASFDEFKATALANFGIPAAAVQIVFVDQPYAQLRQTRNARGDLLFDGWQGLPFGLVFGKDGRLASRGHFTRSAGAEEAQYSFVTSLQKETCAVK